MHTPPGHPDRRSDLGHGRARQGKGGEVLFDKICRHNDTGNVLPRNS